MLGAVLIRKALFVRHCGNWTKPRTCAEKFWRRFMETTAGGRNVMLATGGSDRPPSAKNPHVHWIFSSSLTRNELHGRECTRSFPGDRMIRLIIVARQESAKGAGTVIESLPRLARSFPHITFEIVGDGSAIPEFKRLASEIGVEDRVRFCGKLNHEGVMTRLREATLFVFPTTSSDGFPKAVLEGLAAGLPVVATRVSVLPKLLASGSGVLIDEPTPDAVAAGIEQALGDTIRYEAMSRQAIETARQYSLESWRDTIGAYLESAWGPLKSGAVRLQKPLLSNV
jgi:glycosyltransferase involved in cell wall biosynthesis